MPRHSNFPEPLRVSNRICADAKACKRNFFPQQQRTLDSRLILCLSAGNGPKQSNFRPLYFSFPPLQASSPESRLPVSLGMSSDRNPSILSVFGNLVPRVGNEDSGNEIVYLADLATSSQDLQERRVGRLGGGGGKVLPKKLGRGVRPASQNPYPIYDQNLRFCLPYL